MLEGVEKILRNKIKRMEEKGNNGSEDKQKIKTKLK